MREAILLYLLQHVYKREFDIKIKFISLKNRNIAIKALNL